MKKNFKCLLSKKKYWALRPIAVEIISCNLHWCFSSQTPLPPVRFSLYLFVHRSCLSIMDLLLVSPFQIVYTYLVSEPNLCHSWLQLIINIIAQPQLAFFPVHQSGWSRAVYWTIFCPLPHLYVRVPLLK